MMLQAALEAAANGWAVFPCNEVFGPYAKSPCTSRGHLDATTDPEQIARWWARRPHALIGAPVPDGLLVIDTDPRNGADEHELRAVLGDLPDTLTVHSGRNDGGRHRYYRVPENVALTSTPLPRGVDLKVGGKGYCILPPSLHPNTGLPYRWEGTEAAWLPVAALQVITVPPRKPQKSPSCPRGGGGLVAFVAGAQEGNRNRSLFWAACRAAEDGQLDALEAELIAAAESAGLPRREAETVIRSAHRAVIA